MSQGATLEKYTGLVRSASGEPLGILGKCIKCKASVQNKQIVFNPLVMENLGYVILGMDVLSKHGALLIDILEKKTLNQHERKTVTLVKEEDIVKEFEDLFKTEIGEMNLCTAGTHSIDTGDHRPVYTRNSRIALAYEPAMEAEIEKLLRLGIIRESKSPWCSRVSPADKKDGTVRLCVDYRRINALTRKDTYPLPRIDEILDDISGAEYFSCLDATSGYYQLAMSERDKEKTAFAWKGGLFEFNRMPFGLCNAPATFQRAMDNVFRKENRRFVIPYLDDIVIFSKTRKKHEATLKVVLGKIRAAGLSLNRKKCKFFKKEITILGHVVTKGRIKADPEKIEAIRKYPKPTTIKELRSFLGTINYNREFIKDFATLTAPLYEILKGKKKNSAKRITMTENQQNSFEKLKKILCENTERAQPNRHGHFILTTDASDTGIGAILAQKDEVGRERMIAAFSKNFDKCQKNYSVTDKELLGVVKGIENFRHYLLGKEFTLRTDHRALTYLWQTKTPGSRLMRWILKLSEYTFKPEYIKGEDNIADGLSRIQEMKDKSVNTVDIHQTPDERTRESILRHYHIALGHGSANAMKYMVTGKYNWKGIYKDITDFVDRCTICLKGGGARRKTKNRIILTESPNELWEADLIGPLIDGGRSKYILTAVDHYSKWLETKILENKNAATVVGAIEELILRRHGIPKRILTDKVL
ncbi:Retrovirus-related Pol polyprotein from transposon [Nosema granulosis]|uniref:Retrovirus-related Pol polyprotein from transposon n=1 Tax=Nosema granulosis TaxID=83296 RepID=A0A9P6KZ88_9MICR|nr:Retrovirus-related Pol polyprotein from transposon [Nosema granulosis]